MPIILYIKELIVTLLGILIGLKIKSTFVFDGIRQTNFERKIKTARCIMIMSMCFLQIAELQKRFFKQTYEQRILLK